jgi:hypothetical protein
MNKMERDGNGTRNGKGNEKEVTNGMKKGVTNNENEKGGNE